MISRRITKQRTGRRFITAFATVGLLAGSMLASGTALAVHADGLFELDTTNDAAICDPLPAPCGDANVANDPAVPGDDWEDIVGDSNADTSFIPDPVSSAENSYYTGGGSKDIRPISAWAYGTANDPVPDKDDIADAFAAPYTDGDGHTIIYFGIDRYDNNGDAETGFWFFKSPVSTDGSGGFTGEHTVGDLLVLANWGGSNPVGELTVYEWVGGKNPLALLSDNLAADCATAESDDNACAVVNRQTVSQSWDFEDKGGSTSIRPLELFEGGVDVFDLTGANTCFTSFLAATRSSHSTTAQLKDFVLGPFEECGASISTNRGTDTELVLGESISDTATVHVTGSGTPPAPVGDVTFSVSYNSGAFTSFSVVNLSTAVQSGDDYTVTSAAYTPQAVGSYCFSASWPGDTVYTDGPYTDNGDNECFTVVALQPQLTTAQTWTVKDSATVSVSGSTALAGSVTFELWDNANCNTTNGGTMLYTENKAVTGLSPVTVSTTVTLQTTFTTSKPTLYWKVSYDSTEAAHNDIAATCTENSSLTITN